MNRKSGFIILCFYFLSIYFTSAQNLWNKYYPISNIVPQKIALTNDGKIVFGGQSFITNNSDAAIGLIDSVGNLSWIKTIGSPTDYSYNYYVGIDNAYRIISVNAFDSSTNRQIHISMLDTSGIITRNIIVHHPFSFDYPESFT